MKEKTSSGISISKYLNARSIIWGVYISLLFVLLPHTAWAFSLFEPRNPWGKVAGWAAAIAFECATAVLTHKLSEHVGLVKTRRKTKDGTVESSFSYQSRLFRERYMNAYTYSLAMSTTVSVMANIAHTVQYGSITEIAILNKWNISFTAFAIVFGGFLPLCSVMFAKVLSNVNDAELYGEGTEKNWESMYTTANNRANRLEGKRKTLEETVQSLQAKLKGKLKDIQSLQDRVKKAEALVNADFEIIRFSENKGEVIRAASRLYPDLKPNGLSQIADCVPSYVKQALSSNGNGSK